MDTVQTGNAYAQIFRNRAFRAFWLSFTLSALGDTLTRTALTWFVYDRTRSPEALGLLALTYTGPVIIGGLLALTYTGPVIIGGLLAGPLLDRFDRRKVMIVDNLIRGGAVLLIPLLNGLGLLELWHIYAISAVYGSLMMVSLAGSPSLVPELVEERHLETANALETLSYTLSGVIGPPLAGFLIPLIGAPNIILFDGLSYILFAVTLFSIRLSPKTATADAETPSAYRLSDAVRLLLSNRVLLSTTLMFMMFNLGFGALLVWLPILSDQVLNGGAELYGLLLGAMALGEVISSVLVGAYRSPAGLGKSINTAQALSGMALVLLLGLTIPSALVSLFALGFFSAPLT
ncbi:MAG: MFS transporter, partial [Anaerolineae bacterium]|nr:MFS transporter [Anaerolineae bacterium]